MNGGRRGERLDKNINGWKRCNKSRRLAKYTKSNFEGLSLRNIESLQDIILPIREEILEIAEDNSYLENELKM